MSVPFEIPDWLIDNTPPAPPDTSNVDPHNVEDLVNRFIDSKQDALFTGPDAYYRTEGRDAVDGAPAILDRLNDLRNTTLDAVGDDGTRSVLAPRLDAHLDDANDGIDRHVTTQRDALARQIISERQSLIQRAVQLEHNNDNKLAGLAEAHASAAAELARMNGEPEAAAMDAARSAIWRTAIDQHLANGNGPQAVDLFDQAKDHLQPADLRHLDQPIQSAVLNRTADQWIAQANSGPSESIQASLQADPNLSPVEKAIVQLKLQAIDSAKASDRAAAVKGLDDSLGTTAKAFATAPMTYRPGALSALVNAYEDAGATDSAAALHRVATHEPLLLPFAQLSADKQTAALDTLPAEARPAAEAVQRDQAVAFAKDAFTAGTTLYPDVGAAVPVEDIAGRITQARKISERRGMPVAPFTADEIAGMRRTLAEGLPEERDALLTRVNALPGDMKAALTPQLTPQRPSDAVSNIPSDYIANHDNAQPAPTSTEEGANPSNTAGGGKEGKGPSLRIDADFEAFKREMEKGRDRVAAEQAAKDSGGQGAPSTEPAPGSPEYQAADAEARRIVAEQDAKPNVSSNIDVHQETAAPSSSQRSPAPARTASIVALPAAGSAGGLGQAAWEAVKDLGAASARALPWLARGVGATAAAGTILLVPSNTGSTLQEIGDGLRLRINPDERTVRIERRVHNGFLNTGIGAKWEELPVDAEQVDTPAGQRMIVIDGASLKRTIGDETFMGLNVPGIAMAKPPLDGEPGENQCPAGKGHNNPPPDDDKPENEQRSVGIGHNNPPEPMAPGPPSQNPGPAAAPIVKDETLPSGDQQQGEEVRRHRIRETAEYIAGGHARTEHLDLRREYPGVTPLEFVNMIEQTMLHPSYSRNLPKSGRKAYWDAKSNLLVVENPNDPDGGTAFKRVDGPRYIRTMVDR